MKILIVLDYETHLKYLVFPEAKCPVELFTHIIKTCKESSCPPIENENGYEDDIPMDKRRNDVDELMPYGSINNIPQLEITNDFPRNIHGFVAKVFYYPMYMILTKHNNLLLHGAKL